MHERWREGETRHMNRVLPHANGARRFPNLDRTGGKRLVGKAAAVHCESVYGRATSGKKARFCIGGMAPSAAATSMRGLITPLRVSRIGVPVVIRAVT